MNSSSSARYSSNKFSPTVRLIFFGLLSLVLLFIDSQYKYLEFTRTKLSLLTNPLQQLVIMPGKLWQEIDNFFTIHNRLISSNAELRQLHTLDAAQLKQLQVLEADNQHLRSLLALQQRADYTMQLAEIIYTERNIVNRKVLLDKGALANVLTGQVVMDDNGIVGQVTRVYPRMSEVTLITDKNHTVPVQILRNGLRTLIFGSGDTGELILRYTSISADIQEGDLLVTSGIDGVYPVGLPVAKVTRVERDPAYPFARVLCTPIAGVDKQRQLLILSTLPTLPERPEATQEPTNRRSKNIKREGR